MNIQNHTRLPDAFWDKLLHAAKKAIGIEFETSDTIVELVTSHSNHSHGLAWDRTSMPIGRGSKKHYVTCKNRWFKLWTPIPRGVVENPIGYVMVIYKLAAHELRHVADYHINDAKPGSAPFMHYSNSGRRIKWANRPHEKRAVQSESNAIDECVEMYREFMNKCSAPKIHKVKVYPTEPIVQLTKLQHDWMYERVVFNYEGCDKGEDVDRETLIFHLRKGLATYEIELSDMGARSCFCDFLSDMRWSSEPGEARSAGRLMKQLRRRSLWYRKPVSA
jgi:hypothetical protein